MRTAATRLWRVGAVAAFGATAALAVTLSQSGPVHVALASAGAAATHAAAPRPAAGTARCGAAGLRIWLAPGDRVVGAVARYLLEFTNVSRTPCTLAGYPQVAAYRGAALVGPAAARDASAAARAVLLAPGQTAHAVVDAVMPAARCRPAPASGLRVTVPGQAVARDVGRHLTACTARSARGQGYLHVRAIQPGAGTDGGPGTLADMRPSPGGP